MNINDLFPSKYLDAADLGDQEFPVTIRSVVVEQIPKPQKKNEFEAKPVLYFLGAAKGLVLSKVNAKTIGTLYGPNTDQWLGQRITLYVEYGVEAFGKTHNPVRVRPQAPTPEANEAVVDEPQPEPLQAAGHLPPTAEEAPPKTTPQEDLRDRLHKARQKFQQDFQDVGLALFDKLLIHYGGPTIDQVPTEQVPVAIAMGLHLHKVCVTDGPESAGGRFERMYHAERLEANLDLAGAKRLKARSHHTGFDRLVEMPADKLARWIEHLEYQAQTAT